MTRKLEILVLNPDETYAGFLDPEVTDITETNKYGGIRELHIQHPWMMKRRIMIIYLNWVIRFGRTKQKTLTAVFTFSMTINRKI